MGDTIGELIHCKKWKPIAKSVPKPVESIRIDGNTQPRAKIDTELVSDYATEIKENDASFPAVVVFYDGVDYWLADGFHRWHAHRKAGKKTILCDVYRGTQRDAILYSVGANTEHGQRRTNEDKRKAVLTLLNDEEWSAKSDRWVAKKCGVGNQLVSMIRNELCDSHTSPVPTTTLGQDGKSYPRRPNRPQREPPANRPPENIPPPANNQTSKQEPDMANTTSPTDAPEPPRQRMPDCHAVAKQRDTDPPPKPTMPKESPIEEARRELLAWKSHWGHLNYFAPVIEAIDALE